MTQTQCFGLVLVLATVPYLAGCDGGEQAVAEPPVETAEPAPAETPDAVESSDPVSENAPSANATPDADNEAETPDEAVENPDDSAGGSADDSADGGAEDATESAMIRVKNPDYNSDDPLMFDSGYFEDNSSCMVCHIDFQEEKIAMVHEEQGITCAGCHGDSVTHSGDEFNITRPDVIWGRAEIEHFCRQCHAEHDHPEKVAEFREKWLSKRRENGRVIQEDSVCTDCHGDHAIVGEEGDFNQ